MITAFSTALSALKSISTAVNVVGNNLANLNTLGYKAETFAFHDMVSEVMGSSQTSAGAGVSGALSVRQFSQGPVQQTAGAFDAAISGNGFFLLKNQSGQTLYTRAGNFTIDSSGALVTSTGESVQGWNAVGGVLNPSGAVDNIRVPLNGVAAATATTKMSVNVNLDARGTVDESSGTYSAPIQVVDSQGGAHTLTVTFTKTAPNEWSYAVTIPDADLTDGAGTPVAEGTLRFGADGKLTEPGSDAPISVEIHNLADGAADMTIEWGLYAGGASLLTQFAHTSSVSEVIQDGTQAGQIVNVSMSDGGLIVARYSNGKEATIAQLAVAAIQNPSTLVSAGNNNLVATAETGDPAIGVAGTGGRGQIAGHSLESSTVDIATEFTNLITLQRSFQANSRVITTSDEMLQDIVNLKR